MDFLKHIAFPQSLDHQGLIHLTLNIVYALFVPYTSVLFLAAIIAYAYERAGMRTGNGHYARFARELTESVIPTKNTILLFGILPFLAVFLAYAQLLQNTDTVAVALFFFSFLFFIGAAFSLYTYRYTFRLGEILTIASEAGENEEIDAYARENLRLHARSGLWGIVLFTCSQFIFELGAAASTSPSKVTTFWEAVFSAEAYVRMGQALSFAGVVTGAAILYLFFVGRKSGESDYTRFVRQFAIRLSFISALIVPLFMLFVLAALPATGLTNSVFGVTALVLVMIFAAGHLFYAMLRNFSPRLAANAFFLLVIALDLAVIKDQIAFAAATRHEAVRLDERYTKEQEDLMARLGIGAKAVTGEEIFTGKCSACHTFTEKKVGPPYKETLPKYEGKRDELVAFILNPRKMNPAYPPMPNQGLKPAEADSIAAYIMKTYKEK
ncbi:MAG: c-type cytochrome [Acidobacteriota bacterium]